MEAERWKRIEDLFEAARQKPGDQHAAFLRQACAGDPSVAAEVESLLKAASDGDSFLDGAALSSIAERPPTFKSGETLGNFQILSLLGRGGMGEVWRARDPRLKRDVAIKVLPPAVAQDPGRIARFDREARAASALNHPNIVSVYEIGSDNGVHWIASELINGETLRRLIESGPMRYQKAIDIATQVAAGLAAAHAAGLVHRDLKPENIMVTPGGQVKILDFGLAKQQRPAPGASTLEMTDQGVVMGTVGYMSPEQVRGEPADHRSDLFSFGVVLYEMLCGKQAFAGASSAEVMSAILKEEPHELPHSVPPALARIVGHCLEKVPDRRFQSAADLGFALNATVASAPATESPQRWRNPWPAWAALAVIATAAGFGLWKLSASLATPAPKIVRLAVSIPASQAFVDIPGNSLLFAPDGSAIVYSGRGPKGSQLYYRRLDQLEGRALPGTDNVCCTAISPSGEWVAFERDSLIHKVSVQGGVPIALATVAYQGGLSWESDDSIVSAEAEAGLFRIPANGGPAKRIGSLDPALDESLNRRASGGEGWFMPLVLPDAKSVLVSARKRPRGGATLASVNIADGKVTELEGEGENPIGLFDRYLLFGRVDGTLGVVPFFPSRTRSVGAVIPVLDAPFRRNSGMEATLSATGDLVYVKATSRSRVVFLDTQGHVTGGIPDEREFGSRSLRMSPDGRQFVIQELTDNIRRGELWLYDVASGARQPLAKGVNALTAQWTPDGHRVIFTLLPEAGPSEAWSVPADRSGPPERLIAMPIPIRRTELSPDSRYAVVTAVGVQGGYDLYLVDLKGERQPQMLEQSTQRVPPASFNEANARISPDGRWLAYVSDESGDNEVYVRPFPNRGAHVRVSLEGGNEPHWERDSRGIVYTNGDQFMKARLTVGASGIAVAKRELLFTGRYAGYDLMPNGTIVALRPGIADAQIIVVTNWIGELKAKLGKK